MATPIQSFQDILDVLEQNPEYREAMRRYILDEEFRRLPADVRELRESIASLAQAVRESVAATNARLDRLEEGQAELKADVTELKADVTELKADVIELKADVTELKADVTELKADVIELKADVIELKADVIELKADVTELKADVTELKADVTELKADVTELKVDVTELKAGQIRLEEGQARLEGRIGDVAGTAYERRIVKHSRSIVGRYLGIKRAKILRSINVTEQEALDGLMETATEAGSVTEEQGYELDLADIIIAGSSAPGGANYAVIEVSETIDDNDVDRAHERAAILARAVSEPVTAAVIGKGVSDANRQRAAQSSVTVIIMAE